MEPTFCNKAFGFYGTYVKISEPQKYKYAETNLVNFYRDLLEELLMKNDSLQYQVEELLRLNGVYERLQKNHQSEVDTLTARCEQLQNDLVA